MQTTNHEPDKRTDHNRDASRDIALIDEQTIRRLADEPDVDEPACRFAAVARSLEQSKAPNTQFRFPVTRVAYVDKSGRFALERSFFGHRDDWNEIPRTIAVTAEDEPMVRRIPTAHGKRYAPILNAYQRILSED